MSSTRNPQAEQMADESMVRNLKFQADAVWPQEWPLIEGYDLPDAPQVLDLACGTGEISRRLLEAIPTANLLGIDIHADHIAHAAAASESFGTRARFQLGDAYHLDQDDDSFDLSLCRHLLQAIPDPAKVIAELVRVTKPSGRLHLIVEDYAMMHFSLPEAHLKKLEQIDPGVAPDDASDLFWLRGPIAFARATGSDLRIGRNAYGHLVRAGLTDIRVNYLVIDTLRVSRDSFASIWVAWRDGYSQAIARETDLNYDQVVAHFDAMIAAIRDPECYGVWHLPIISAALPT